ncbi:MAG: MFS transporter [Propionibacteriaceae bacterium]|jgi:oligogalacturonide transporter|nr:MFS transporter [Propionibacteriaceae bacterium]
MAEEPTGEQRQVKRRWMFTPKKITVGRGVEYGLTDLMGGGWNNIVSGVIFTFLMSQGVNPAAAGAVTGIGRIFDALFSLFFGTITDNFYRTKLGRRFGRRHFFIIAGCIVFAILFPMFWLPASQIFAGHEFWFYLIIYVGVELAIASILIPWETLPTEMTTDYTKRTVLSGSRMFISATGTAIVFFVLAILKHMNNPNAYLITGIIWTVIFVVAILVSWRCTWEKAPTPEFLAELDAKPHKPLLQEAWQSVKDFGSTFENKAFRRHLFIYLFSFTGKDLYSIVLPTFIVYVMAMPQDFPWTLQALSAFGILSTLAAAKLMITHGPRFLYTIAYSTMIVAMVAYCACYFLGVKDPIAIFVVVSIFYQLGRGILEFTPWNVFPFIPDVDYLMTRESRAGIYAAVMTFFRKSTGALASWIIGIIFEIVGFDASKPITQGVRDSITWIFLIGVVVLIGTALIAAQGFKLNKETHAVLKAEIERLEAGGSKADVTAEARKVAEELTGRRYIDLWPERNKADKVKH